MALVKLHRTWPGKLNSGDMERYQQAREEAMSCTASQRLVLFHYKAGGKARLLHLKMNSMWSMHRVAQEFSKQALLPPLQHIQLFKEHVYRDCCGARHSALLENKLLGLVSPLPGYASLIRVVYEAKKNGKRTMQDKREAT